MYIHIHVWYTHQLIVTAISESKLPIPLLSLLVTTYRDSCLTLSNSVQTLICALERLVSTEQCQEYVGSPLKLYLEYLNTRSAYYLNHIQTDHPSHCQRQAAVSRSQQHHILANQILIQVMQSRSSELLLSPPIVKQKHFPVKCHAELNSAYRDE